MLHTPKCLGVLLATTVVLSACSMAKIESRLEANPQCKEVVNPKTGATMPCPGPELLARSQTSGPTPVSPASNSVSPNTANAATPATATTDRTPTPVAPRAQPAPPCKPQMNTKTGSIMPCPNG